MSAKWKVEILLLLTTMVVAMLILLPLKANGILFDFYAYNFIFIVTGLTFARYILWWRLNPLSASRPVMLGIICAVPLIIFPIIEGFHSFTLYIDTIGLQDIVQHLDPSRRSFFMKYIRTEYLLFAVMTFAGGLLLIVKMLRELSRSYADGE